MQRLAPEGDVFHGGTFAGHPLSMAAGIATLRALRARRPYQQLERISRRLASGLREAAHDAGVSVQVNQAASMMTVFFADGPVTHFAQAKASNRRQFARWANALRRRGILIPPSPFEALFVSTAHRQTEIDRMIRAARGAFADAARERA
jgi:glutamate-1-semialdehyde 2,1-aminomutase